MCLIFFVCAASIGKPRVPCHRKAWWVEFLADVGIRVGVFNRRGRNPSVQNASAPLHSRARSLNLRLRLRPRLRKFVIWMWEWGTLFSLPCLPASPFTFFFIKVGQCQIHFWIATGRSDSGFYQKCNPNLSENKTATSSPFSQVTKFLQR